MKAPLAYLVGTLVVGLFAAPGVGIARETTLAPCGASAASALQAIADGLSSTSGTGSHPEDLPTLKAALESSERLRACGNERDSISAELIAADAYSDVYPNAPRKRCAALRDARKRLRALGDTKRAQMVSRTLVTGSSCL